MLLSCFRTYRLQRLLELLLSLVVVAGLMAAAVRAYGPVLEQARMMHIFGNPFVQKRLNASLFFALQGRWPQNDTEAQRYGLEWEPPFVRLSAQDVITRVRTEEGAIHVTLSNTRETRCVTLRPAVPAGDHFGPVIWVCGNQRDADQWHVFGPDKTDVNARYIPGALH